MTTPPGTVPLMNYASDKDHQFVHEHNDHPRNATCDGMKCKLVGFRVVDAEAFNSWLEKLRRGSTLVE